MKNIERDFKLWCFLVLMTLLAVAILVPEVKAQPNNGAFKSPNINTFYYPGVSPYTTSIQSAATAACASATYLHKGIVVVLPGFTLSDVPTGVTGCAGVTLEDKSQGLPWACYVSTGGLYTAAACVSGGGGGSYLPLTGGTLTGPLNGTSSTFSGSVTTPTLNLTGGPAVMTSSGFDLAGSDFTFTNFSNLFFDGEGGNFVLQPNINLLLQGRSGCLAADPITRVVTGSSLDCARPSTVAPLMDGTAAVGTSALYARQDHVHPTDTTRAPATGSTAYVQTAPSGSQTQTQPANTSYTVVGASNSTFDATSLPATNVVPNASLSPLYTTVQWPYEFVSVQGTAPSRVYVYNISTGAQVLVGSTAFSGCAFVNGLVTTNIAGVNILVAGCNDTGTLYTLSISSAGVLTSLGSVSGLTNSYPGIAIDGTDVYVPLFGAGFTTTGSVAKVSIATPASPSITATVVLAGSAQNPAYIAVSGNYLYVETGHEPVVANDSTIQVLNKTTMTLVGSPLALPHSPQQVYIQGQILFVTNHDQESLSSIDISNPASLAVLQSISLPSCAPIPVIVRERYAYVGCYDGAAIIKVDVSQPANMRIVQTFSGFGHPQQFSISGRFMFSTDGVTGGSVYMADTGGYYAQQLASTNGFIKYFGAKDLFSDYLSVKNNGHFGGTVTANGFTDPLFSTAGCVTNTSTGMFGSSACGFVNPMTTLGDIIYGGSAGAPTRLAGFTVAGTYNLCETATGSAAAPTWCNAPITIASAAHQFLTSYSAVTGLFFQAAIAAGDLPLATNAAIGGMKGDTTTISCVAGVCSAVGGGSSTAFQANGTPLSSSTTVNFQNGTGNGGVVYSNPSAGIVQSNLSLPLSGGGTPGAAFTTGPASGTDNGFAVCFMGTFGNLRECSGNSTPALTNGANNFLMVNTFKGIVAGGTTFTIASGCGTTTSLTGGENAGSFAAGQISCVPVITPGFTAPHGFSCWANDLTTPADTIHQTATTTTTVTLSGTVISADVINFGCIAY